MLHLNTSLVLGNVARRRAVSRLPWRPFTAVSNAGHKIATDKSLKSTKCCPLPARRAAYIKRNETCTSSLRSLHTTSAASGPSGVAAKDETQDGGTQGLEITPLQSHASLTLFGRDVLVDKTVETLLNHHHVALLGQGGIGKTSVAKAILEHENIVQKFGDERYFISFDDLDMLDPLNPNAGVPWETFIRRILDVLELALPGDTRSLVDRLKHLSWKFQSNRIFLVLDHAEQLFETVETSTTATESSITIASIIEELATRETVTLLMTTHKSRLPETLKCTPVLVQPLDIDATRETFVSVYESPCDEGVLEPLFKDLLGVPLAVTLVAEVARQNHWTPEEVVKAWSEAKASILSTSAEDDTERVLAASISLALDSEVLSDAKEEAFDILRAAAFFPQGVQKAILSKLPLLPSGQSIDDVLFALGLIHPKDNLLTMSAPLRKCISTVYGADIGHSPLVIHIRSFYSSQLTPGKSLEEFSWLFSEDKNVEKLLVYDLKRADDTENITDILGTIYPFINHLAPHMTWSTSLEQAVINTPVPHEDSIQSASSQTRDLVDMKAVCLCGLGDLALAMQDHSKAMKMWEEGLKLSRLVDSEDGIRNFINRLADLCITLGNFPKAQEYLKETLERPIGSSEERALNFLALGRIKAYTGDPQAAELFDRVLEMAQDHNGPGIAKLGLEWRGDVAYHQRDHETARSCLEALINLCKQDRDMVRLFHALLALHAVAIREGDVGEAMKLLDQAKKVAMDEDPGLVASTYALTASIAEDAGDLDGARIQLKKALVEVRSTGMLETQGEGLALYLSGRLELLAGDYEKSKTLFQEALFIYRNLPEVSFEARILRALGEISLLEGDRKAALSSFRDAEKRCDSIGTHPDILYKCMCIDTLALPERFGGWESFLDGRMEE
ncbi:TPR-like protein [Pluteus cervinus]|uniref:TPR-like protein n=1 Tax=Pluteus cervinus TaxID=181527 RepID=A0ACD3ANV4_9AGAR|nr:TPR-like protein [Pluteus cervinus]